MTDFETPTIYVLAGVNGAGKSSIGGAELQGQDSSFYNPDLAAVTIRAIHPLISDTEANSHAWKIGRTLLEQAIAKRVDFRFETTLGGNTIPQLLEQATGSGLRVQIWFAGLSSPEMHIQRVAARVARGGHPIPEAKIRERWNRSRENLIKLLPVLDAVRVFDNSADAPPGEGRKPVPVLVLEMQQRKITAPADLSHAPGWAKPIVAAAMRLHRL